MNNSNGTSNLLSLAEAKLKYQQNQRRILLFLHHEKYSTARILQQIIGLETRSGVCRVLNRMERENLIKRHQYTYSIILWGITPNGLHEAIDGRERITDWTYFEPSKISFTTLEHQLDIQRFHALCFQRNIKFQLGRTIGSRSNADKIPDAIIYTAKRTIAIEIERSIKTKRRYREIIYNYLKAVKRGDYNRILYVAPTPAKCRQVRNVFFSVKKIMMKINGVNKPLTLNPDYHLRFFEFVALENAESYLAQYGEIN
jgi:hypothetical protein